MIEHIIALRSLVQGGDDAVTSVLRAHQRWLERMQESAKQARWPVAEDPAFDEMLGIEPGASSQDRNLHIKHRCEEYGTDNVYSGWLVETNASHPSFSTATAYLQMAPELEKVELGDRPVDYPGAMLGLVAWDLLWRARTSTS